MTTGERIRIRREQLGMTQEDLAIRIGYKSRSSINKIEIGAQDLVQSKIKSVADALRTTPGYIMGWTELDEPSVFEPLPAMRQWTVLGATACGEPLHRELEETIQAPDNIDADFTFRCVGDSMIGARILDGDFVFVKRGVDVQDGQIAVVRVGDEYTLKRIYRGFDYLELRSENPAYPPIILRGEDLDAEIVGKAVQFLSRII